MGGRGGGCKEGGSSIVRSDGRSYFLFLLLEDQMHSWVAPVHGKELVRVFRAGTALSDQALG